MFAYSLNIWMFFFFFFFSLFDPSQFLVVGPHLFGKRGTRTKTIKGEIDSVNDTWHRFNDDDDADYSIISFYAFT